MSTITNQTLTLTITSGSVDTVIRKDNCRVDTFGDYVRLTDYTGERYEFLFSDITNPSTASAVELAEAIEEFLNTGGGGGGGGVETVTGGLVDNTDPANPVVSAPDGTWTPSVSATNDAVVNASSAYYIYTGGSVCQFSISFQIELGVGEIQTTITVGDLPVPSTFTTSRQAIIAATGAFDNLSSIGVQTNVSNLEIAVVSPNAGASLAFSVVGHYEVL